MIGAVVFGAIAIFLWILTFLARSAFTSKHPADSGVIVLPVSAIVSSAISLGILIRINDLRGIVLPILLVIMGLAVVGAVYVMYVSAQGVDGPGGRR